MRFCHAPSAVFEEGGRTAPNYVVHGNATHVRASEQRSHKYRVVNDERRDAQFLWIHNLSGEAKRVRLGNYTRLEDSSGTRQHVDARRVSAGRPLEKRSPSTAHKWGNCHPAYNLDGDASAVYVCSHARVRDTRATQHRDCRRYAHL